MIEEREDHVLEVGAINLIDLGGNAQRDPGPTRGADRRIWAFLGRDPAEKQEVRTRLRLESIEVRGQAVVQRRDPIGVGHGRALSLADRHQGYLRIVVIQRGDIREIEASVQGNQRGVAV